MLIVACGSGQEAPPASWIQLEQLDGAEIERAMQISANGSFGGLTNSSEGEKRLEGQLSQSEIAMLMELTLEEHLTAYEKDALPEDTEHDSDRRFRVVVRNKAQQNGSEGELLEATFGNENLSTETLALLAIARSLLDTHLQQATK
jgi:hypothetical protein